MKRFSLLNTELQKFSTMTATVWQWFVNFSKILNGCSTLVIPAINYKTSKKNQHPLISYNPNNLKKSNVSYFSNIFLLFLFVCNIKPCDNLNIHSAKILSRCKSLSLFARVRRYSSLDWEDWSRKLKFCCTKHLNTVKKIIK